MSYLTKAFAPLGVISLCLLNEFTALQVTALPIPASKTEDIVFLGQVTLPTGTQFERTEIGGLSGITYDPTRNVYYAISDDRSEKSPARFYTLRINLSQDSLPRVDFINVTTLLDKNREPFAPLSLDPEGIALISDDRLYISSEGDANQLFAPFINQFSLTGKQFQELPIPEKFLPIATQESGIRNNLAFESLTVTPNQIYLFTATENALYQDGSVATTSNGSFSRILQYDLITGQPEQEFLYITDPVAAEPNSAEIGTNGLVDLLAVSSNRLLSLERSFSTGVGNTIKLYDVSLEEADDISNINSLEAVKLSKVEPARKTLLIDFSQLNIPLDNIEGITLGPDLEDGRRSLVVISDNNFSKTQYTQILVFGIR